MEAQPTPGHIMMCCQPNDNNPNNPDLVRVSSPRSDRAPRPHRLLSLPAPNMWQWGIFFPIRLSYGSGNNGNTFSYEKTRSSYEKIPTPATARSLLPAHPHLLLRHCHGSPAMPSSGLRPRSTVQDHTGDKRKTRPRSKPNP